jgi:Fe-S-cluster containining protein
MDISLLEELQSKFKCNQCGKCCAVGGDIDLDFDDVMRIVLDLDYTYCDFINTFLVRIPNEFGHFRIKDTCPCCFLDKFSMGCQIHSSKPRSCRYYPFLLYARGECNLDAVLTCPVAVKMLEDHLKGVE